MRRDQGGLAGGERAELLPQPVHARGVEAVRGLVEDQEARLAKQSRRDRDPLPHAEGVRTGTTAGVAAHPDLGQDGLEPVGVHACSCGGDGEVLASGPGGVQAVGVEDDADLLGRALELPVRHAEDEGVSGVRGDEAEQDADGRGLAGAVGAQEARDASRTDGEADVVDAGGGPGRPSLVRAPRGAGESCRLFSDVREVLPA